MRMSIVALIIAALAFAAPAFAGTVLNFGELPINTIVTNQYAGVVFSGISGSAPIIVYDSAMPTEPVLSPNPAYAGDFLMTFVGGAHDVSFISGYWDAATTGIVKVYDPSNNLLATLTNGCFDVGCTPTDGVFLFDLSGYGTIGSVSFDSFNDPAGADIDNLSFAVPEPGSLVLLGAGLLAAAFRRKRAL